MNVQRFVTWCETANRRRRADGYLAIASAVLADDLPPADREIALALLDRVLDDPSPAVRREVAAFVGGRAGAPRSLLRGFLADTGDIAIEVAHSRDLTPEDLARVLPAACETLRITVARRQPLHAAVAAAIARHGGLFACRTLVDNRAADLTEAAIRRISDRFGSDPVLRGELAERRDLPADVRQALVLETARALQSSMFVCRTLGEPAAARVAFNAAERATARIGGSLAAADIPTYVEHLRATGQMSPAFLLRLACIGDIDLLAAALADLSSRPQRRVRAVLVDGREGAFFALTRDCGLSEAFGRLVHAAVSAWKDVATGRVRPGDRDASDAVMRRVLDVASGGAGGQAAAMLNALRGEIERDARRARMDELLAA